MPTPEELVNSIFGGDTGGAAPEGDDNQEPKTPENPDTSEGKEPGEEQNKEPEKLFAGKYKTIEEMEEAYKKAEKDFHDRRQELADLRREVESLRQLLTPKQPEQDPKQYREQILERLYEEPDTVIAELAEKIADRKLQEHLGPIMPIIQQQVINSQVQQFLSSVPDAAEYAGDMATIIQTNPELVNQPGWLEKAYLQAKVARLEARLGKNAAVEKTAQAAAAKQAAAMPKGGKGEPAEPKTREEKLVDAIFGGGGGGGIFG